MTKPDRPRFSGFNLIDPGFMADPYETVVRVHKEAPVFYDDTLDAWVITKYDDIAAALATPQIYSARAVGRIPAPADILPRVPDFAVDEIIFALDPPEHTLARMTMQLGFSKRIVDGLAEPINLVVDQVIDRIIDRGECNLITDFCYPVSMGVITHMLDLPEDRRKDYRRWSEALFALLVPKTYVEGTETFKTSLPESFVRERWNDLAEANTFLRNIVEERALNPKEDIISVMLQARDAAGGMIDPGAVFRHVLSLITAGHDTTANSLANIVLLLSRNPDQLATLKNDSSLFANAAEEGLRRRGPTATLFRITTADVEVRGHSIPQGSLICLLLPGANLDPDFFPDPAKFDIKRSNVNRHLAFGRGRHACIGQPLARIEIPIALQKLYARMPDLHVDPSVPVVYEPTFGGATISQIITRWTPPKPS